MADAEAFLKRHDEAKRRQDLHNSILDECYEFCLPLRERPFGRTGASAKRTDRLFDFTAVEALQDFASQRLEDVWPTDQKPIELRAGEDVPEQDREAVNRALAQIGSFLTEIVNASNFRDQAQEANKDYGIATGILLVDAGDALQPIVHRALPLNEAVLRVGPFGAYDALYRTLSCEAWEIPVKWPEARLTDDMRKAQTDDPMRKFELIEGYERDWSGRGEEAWKYCLADKATKTVMLSDRKSGVGSQPFVAYSYSRPAGEVLGRGPAQIALPEIRSANAVRELLLEHLDLSIGGLWQYEDNGVVNVDTIRLRAGTIIPKMMGSAGLTPVEVGGNPQFGAVELQRMQENIRGAFFKLDLGPVDKTPRSATEVMQRVADRAGRLSGPNARMLTEFLFPYVRRALYILRDLGLVKLPRLDGRFVVIRPLAPITRSQAQDDILRHINYAQQLAVTVGPQVAQMLIDAEKFGEYIGAKMGVEPNVIRTKIERQQLAQAMAAMAAQAAQTQTKVP